MTLLDDAREPRQTPEPARLLEVQGLNIAFAHPRPAVNCIDVAVDAGEVVALVGESGSGKSMTARAIMGLLPPGARAGGSIRLAGEEILGAPDSVMNRIRGAKVGLIFQEPQSALNPVRRIGWQLHQAMAAHGKIGRAEARERAVELLRQVEIPEPERRVNYYPHQLSGGQKQRVAIALALANEPALLLADEPTTALDVTVQAEILDLLQQLRETTGMGILLITHNMGVVAERADRLVVLKSGDVKEAGSIAEVFGSPRDPYTRQLLDAVPRLSAATGVADPGPCRASVPDALTLSEATVEFPPRHGNPALRAVDGVTLDVRAGEILGLVGESGSGKTTLGRAIAGLVPVTEGTIEVAGQVLAGASADQLRRLRRDLAFVHQDPAASLDPRFTVGRSIREPLDIHREGSADDRTRRVAELLEAVRLPASFANRLPHQLSGGQRQRVALARALALAPKLVIADEPTSALDVLVQSEVLGLFHELHRELGFSAVFISHDLAVVHDVADRVAVMQAGRLVEIGAASAVLTNPAAAYTRELVGAVPVVDAALDGRRALVAVS